MPRSRKFAVYDHTMSLFRRRAKKNREKAAAGLLTEQTSTAEAQAEAARPEVTAEARPNPDQPGWGRIIGQEIGRSREEHASQE
jgi:hypothetical protein